MQRLPKLETLIHQANKHSFVGVLLAADPGETTGITVMQRNSDGEVHLIHQEQMSSWPLHENVSRFDYLMSAWRPTFFVHEAYHVYKWRLQEHSFSRVPTIQIIGSMLTIAILRRVPYVEQTAQTGKAFFKDELLKRLDMYIEGQPHARDSLRHGAQWLMFGTKEGS